MSIGAELGQYFANTKFKKNSEDSMGGLTTGYASVAKKTPNSRSWRNA